MRRRLAGQDGSALIAAMLIMVVILGLGFGLLLLTDNQQKASAREQWQEQAFNVAEAALNAQVGQLSRVWPTEKNAATVAVSRCTEGESNGVNYCPAKIPLSVGYGALSKIKCPVTQLKEAWGSPLKNQWTTYVRSAAKNPTYFYSKTEEKETDYSPAEKIGESPAERENRNKLWVRAVGVVNCHFVTLLTLVSRQEVSVPFPKDALGGNWFKVTNSGGHGGEAIVVAESKNEVGEIAMRCESIAKGKCEEFENGEKGHGTEQIKPYVPAKEPNPSPILNEEQLQAVRSLAESKGTLRSTALGNCPTSLEQLSGNPAYIECGDIKVGDGNANTQAEPGFLVMATGKLTFGGNGHFYGTIYSVNPSNLNEAMVVLGGSTTVEGAIEVDGKGGIELGSNSVNLIYNAQSVIELKGSAGATPTRNTFRVLPASQ